MSFKVFFTLVSFKIQRCQEFFEGPNCEFSVMNSILYDSNEIPGRYKT